MKDSPACLSVMIGLGIACSLQWAMAPTINSPLPLYESWTLQAIHWLTAIPLAILLLSLLPGYHIVLERIYRRPMLTTMVAACAGVLYVGAAILGDMSNQSFAWGFWPAVCVRTTVSALWMSYCVSGIQRGIPTSFASSTSSASSSGARPWQPRDLAWTVALASVLPGIFAWDRHEQLRENFVLQVNSGRLVASQTLAVRLAILNDAQTILGKKPSVHAEHLQRQAAQVRAQLDQPLPPNADVAEILQRTMRMLSLSMLDEAVVVLDLLPADNADAQLLRALAAREQQDWSTAERICDRLLTHADSSLKPQLYEIRCEALANLDRVPEAIESLKAAIDLSAPEASAQLWLQMGALEAERGDYAAAAQCDERAVLLQPMFQTEVSTRSRRLANFTCRLK